MDVSVIIPSYNSTASIRDCLEALMSQKTNFIYEIIVVDSSPDSTVDDIAKEFSIDKFIKLKTKTRPGSARNIGAGEALGDLLVFIDADVVVSREWLESAVLYYRSGHAAFSGSVGFRGAGNSPLTERMEWFYESNEFKPSMPEKARRYLPGANLAVKKTIFEKEKFMDLETSEDIEYTLRLCEKGIVLYFNPVLKSFHTFTATFRQLLKKAFIFGISNMAVRRMHKMSGWSIARNRMLASFVIPLFALIKFGKISWRNIVYNRIEDKLLYMITSPLMILVIMAWMAGFYKGLYQR